MNWEEFFGPGNGLRWEFLHEPAGAATLAALRPFLLLVNENRTVVALPRVSETGTGVQWYVGWREGRDARFARDLLRAFLGRTYALMSSPLRALEPQDPVEHAFADKFGANAFVVEVPAEHQKIARTRLLAMAQCIAARPTRDVHRLRSVGRLLRDVEFSIQQGDDSNAAAIIEELRLGGHLDVPNIEYLSLRRLAAKAAWAEILLHPDLRRLLELGPPRRACDAVVQAIYHHSICPGAALPSPEHLVHRLREALVLYAPAFRSARGLATRESDVCFSVLPIIRRQPRDATVDQAIERLIQAGWADEASLVESAWRQQSGASPLSESQQEGIPHLAMLAPRSWADEATDAFNNDDVDLAYRLALDASPSRARTSMLVRCALAMGDVEATLEALAAWDALTAEERSLALERGRMRDFIARLTDRLGQSSDEAGDKGKPAKTDGLGPPVDGWRAWFERLTVDQPWPGAMSAAGGGQRTWSVEALLSNPNAVSHVVEIMEASLPSWGAEALRNSLPFLLEAFIGDVLDPRGAPILASLFDLLATDDSHSLPSCEALVRLGQTRLAGGAKAQLYEQTLDIIVGAVASISSPNGVLALIDALEMMVEVPCPRPDIRQNAAVRLLQFSNRWWRRFATEHRSLLRGLAAELDASAALANNTDPVERAEEDDPWMQLADKYVALYSLDEAALARTERALQDACSTLRVSTFAEHVATPAMQEAAKRADVFVIATKAATHAATTFIEKFIDSERVAYATGKGSSSLLNAVRVWLKRTAAEN